MPEYLPVYIAGTTLTLKASAPVTAGQLLAATGPGTVGPAGANTVNWVGVASADAATNDNVVVHTGGVQALTASGTVTAGDLVVCAAAGQVSTLAPVTTPTPTDVTRTRGIVGLALTTAGSGQTVRVRLSR